jgi:acetamidase/formamidase
LQLAPSLPRGRLRTLVAAAALLLAIALASPLAGQADAAPKKKGTWHHLRSTPENIVWGGFPIDRPAAITIDSGDTVRIDTLSGGGGTNPNITPEEYFAAFGVGADEILPDLKAFWKSLPGRPQYGPHLLTGPVYVRGAEPGDALKVEVLDLDTRVPYGINSTGPESGVFSTSYPGWRIGDAGLDIPALIPPGTPGGVLPNVRQHLYRTGKSRGRDVAFFGGGIEIPLKPFMGVMGVAPETGTFVGNTPTDPPPASGVQGSVPPGPYGGNLDVNDLGEGSTLYLPVFQPGGQFFTGDAHSVQGDGEVSGTAIEHSLSGTFRFTLVKGAGIDGPWAEDKDRWMMMGIDWDLDRAMRFSVKETIDFLTGEKGFTVPKAFSFASIAVDYEASEVVDRTQVVTGMIPKALFPKAKPKPKK